MVLYNYTNNNHNSTTPSLVPQQQQPQLSTILKLHRTPRWGHSDAFSDYFAPDPAVQADYVQGIVAFGAFLIILLMLWLATLLILKVFLGNEHVGCAAGGDIIDVQYIKKHKRELKPKLRGMVIRSWRIQTCFLISALLLPIFTVLFVKNGLSLFVDGLSAMQTINQDVERVTYRGIGIVDSLVYQRDTIQTMDRDGLLSIETHCPRMFTNTTFNASLTDATTQLRDMIQGMDRLVDENAVYARRGLITMSHVTESVDTTIEVIMANDWIPKFYMMVLTVVTMFLIGGVMLTRSNVVVFPFKCMLVWLLVPAFIILMIMATIGTSMMGMMASINADFCAGGSDISPRGTLEEIVMSHSSSQQDLTYRSFYYYMNACTTDNPFDFVSAFDPLIRSTANQINDALILIHKAGIDEISLDCGADVTPLVDGFERFVKSLEVVQSNIISAVEISDCASISPILNGIMHGETCDEVVSGLSWMYWSTLIITIIGLVMVTLRAALYNPTIRGPKRTKAEETKREFREYKEYMANYYDDAHMWKIQSSPSQKTKNADAAGMVGIASSFETGATSPSSEYSSHASYNHDPDDSGDDDDYSYDSDGDSNNSCTAQFTTPCKTTTTTFVEQIKTAEKIRDLIHILDGELEPLSPDVTHTNSGAHHEEWRNTVVVAPETPQKRHKTLKRTSQQRHRIV